MRRAHPALTASVMAGAVVSAWMLQHGYEGIAHDARLYTLQALAQLQSSQLGNDVFLRFGSQDRFTLFSPVYATVMHLLGVEAAAAALTGLAQVAFLVTAWLLARALMPLRLATCAVALLAAMPSEYGAYGVFHYFENFVSPRMFAQALVLGALAAHIGKRPLVTAACLVTATLLHPLMAAAGVAVCLLLYSSMLRISQRWLAVGIVVTGLLFATVVNVTGQIRFDEAWLHLLSQTRYLFPSLWRLEDVVHASSPLAVLIAGGVLLPSGSSRELCRAMLAAVAAGLVLALIGGDLLHLVLVTQLQSWRWLWLANALAVLLSPLILSQAWKSGALGKAASLLLIAAWLCRTEIHSLVVAGCALAAVIAIARGHDLPRRLQRPVLGGAALLALLCLAMNVATAVLSEQIGTNESSVATLVNQIRDFVRDGALAGVGIAALWWFSFRAPTRSRLICAGGALAVFAALLAPSWLAAWTAPQFERRAHAAFAEWRTRIPPASEVLWVDGAMQTWMLLERPAYLTKAQMAVVLFSRPATMELKRRIDALGAFLQGDGAWPWLERSHDTGRPSQATTLASICIHNGPGFVVTARDLHTAPLAAGPASLSMAYRRLKLYECPTP